MSFRSRFPSFGVILIHLLPYRCNADSESTQGGRAFPLIVAGSVNPQGLFADFTQGRLDHFQVIWAPGTDVVCASGVGMGSVTSSGTSFSAGMVSL